MPSLSPYRLYLIQEGCSYSKLASESIWLQFPPPPLPPIYRSSLLIVQWRRHFASDHCSHGTLDIVSVAFVYTCLLDLIHELHAIYQAVKIGHNHRKITIYFYRLIDKKLSNNCNIFS